MGGKRCVPEEKKEIKSKKKEKENAGWTFSSPACCMAVAVGGGVPENSKSSNPPNPAGLEISHLGGGTSDRLAGPNYAGLPNYSSVETILQSKIKDWLDVDSHP